MKLQLRDHGRAGLVPLDAEQRPEGVVVGGILEIRACGKERAAAVLRRTEGEDCAERRGIDGRQKDYSVGATYEDVGAALKLCGASEGLNLDGGGSTTMAILDDDDEPLVLNRPINGTPDLLRFNGNSIGVTANGKLRAKLIDGRVKPNSGATKFVPAEKTAP